MTRYVVVTVHPDTQYVHETYWADREAAERRVREVRSHGHAQLFEEEMFVQRFSIKVTEENK